MTTLRRRALAVGATAFAVTLVLAGCAADTGSNGGSGGDSNGGSNGDCSAYAEYAGNEGTTVEIYTTIIDPEASLFIESFKEFEDCTGITINWNGSQDFETQIQVRVEGGTAPDLAIFPQPGLLADMVATGQVVPAPQKVADSVAANYTADWKNYGTVDGVFYAAPLGANVKSFVWYSPKTFADNGWSIPTTWAELLALSDQIAAESDVQPWCVGVESGVATGWAATDWMEDLMLRFQSAETYDRWVSNDLAFNSPEVLEVINEADKILRNPTYVGNVQAIATTSFATAGSGLVDGTCGMHRQASFIGGILRDDFGAVIVTPEDTDVEGGITTFYFPGVSADNRPALGGGEFVGAFSDRAEVQAVQHYLTTALWNNKKAALGGWFSAHLGLDTANVADPVNKVAVEILQNASTFRFDASDLMPGAVGAGTFWTEMTAWFAEGKDSQAVLDAIQASWPAN
jgi:alpha-glucoside transport system substrate-binding protein